MTEAALAAMYAETIKMSQEGKISVKNTWDLNLIDHMAELGAEGEGGETNFQVVGVTLDAGVKIYCSRVDSVHTNAFKVLGALSRTTGGAAEGGEGGGEEDGERRKKKRAHRSGGNTLENNIENITERKLETDLVVDPLFQQMSAAFDEGGAKGMLLNNLSVGPRFEVIFDSSEPAQLGQVENEGGEGAEIDVEDDSVDDADEVAGDSVVESSTYSLAGMLPGDGLPESGASLCPQFMTFYRSRVSTDAGAAHSATAIFDTGGGMNDAAEPADFSFEYTDADIHTGGDTLGVMPFDDDDGGVFGNDDDFDNDDDVGAFSAPCAATPSSRRLSRPAFAPDGSLMSSGGVDLVEAGVAIDRDSEYSFFDERALSGWAGPNHWRFRAAATGTNDTPRGDAGTKRPKGKTAMLLDYSSEAPVMDFAAEFAPPKNAKTILLSEGVIKGFTEAKVTLPVDVGYKSQNLATLFLKPKVAVVAKRRRVAEDAQNMDGEDGEDGGGWFDYDNDADNDNFCPGHDGGDANDIFSFDNDGGGDDGYLNALGGADLVDEPTQVEKIDIGFATVAKKVDVRQLKSGMWSQLRAGGEPEAEDENEEAAGGSPGQVPAAAAGRVLTGDGEDIRTGGVQTLQQVVQNMPSFVPKESLHEVSISYVFICLLHLANEKTLDVKAGENGALDDLIISSTYKPDDQN